MNIKINDLKFNKNGEEYPDGYRIVYFYNDNYSIGEYCQTIDGFMIGFAECDPIIDEDDSDDSSNVDIVLDELERFKTLVTNKYEEFMEKEEYKMLLKKIDIIKKELELRKNVKYQFELNEEKISKPKR